MTGWPSGGGRAIGACLGLALCLLAAPACRREEHDSAARRDDAPRAAQGPLPDLGQVPDFSLTDQHGARFGSAELRGRPYLAAFMFTRCPTVCPELTARMRGLALAAADAGLQVDLVSFSVDGEHDTPEVLRAYAEKHGARRPEWHFLTGDSSAVAQTAEQGFKIGVTGKYVEDAPHRGITHGSHLVLVDGSGKIRAYYRSSEPTLNADVLAGLRAL
jgi:protein SCO1/2